MHFSLEFLQHLLDTWGYLAVFVFVLLETSGIPFPGETMLLAAAVYAGSEHIAIQWVITAAAVAAILGDNLGFWAGREGGYRFLRRFGRFLWLDEAKLAWAERFYRRHGKWTVFFGRFVAVLRTWSAFLAGVNDLAWPTFLVFNAFGGILWAVVYGLLGYTLAKNIPLLHKVVRDLGVGSAILVLAAVTVTVMLWRRREHRSQEPE